MRVSDKVLNFLKIEVNKYLKDAKLFVFGSRTDIKKKGGDIDILILSEKKLKLQEKINIRIAFYKKFGEQKIDIVNFTFNEDSVFKNYILEKAIEF